VEEEKGGGRVLPCCWLPLKKVLEREGPELAGRASLAHARSKLGSMWTCVCMCACVRARVYVYVHVCVCVRVCVSVFVHAQ